MPGANPFMAMLFILSVVIVAMVVGILLLKLIVETWALCGHFPESLKVSENSTEAPLLGELLISS